MLQKALHGRVLQLTLNRPEKRNALNTDLCSELVTVIEDGCRDHSVGAILLQANGKSFCAGMDLEEASSGVTEQINTLHQRLFTLGARMCKPLLGAVQGAALGGGAGLVANCHIVVAAPDVTFGLTEIRLGLWPFLVHYAVASALGERRTLELALTGRIFDAAEARKLDLVHEISDDPQARALEIAHGIANSSPTAIQNGMSFVQEVRGKDFEDAAKVGRRIRDRVVAGPDFQEGVNAFREKRPPKWPSLSH